MIPFSDDNEHLETDDGELFDEEVVEEIAIDAPVIMDEDITDTDDTIPVNRWVSMFQLARKTLDALADDDDAADDGIFLRRVVAKRLFIKLLHVRLYHIDAIDNELQKIACFCIHSIGVWWRSIWSRNLGRTAL